MQNNLWVLYKRKMEKIGVGKVTNSDLESVKYFGWISRVNRESAGKNLKRQIDVLKQNNTKNSNTDKY